MQTTTYRNSIRLLAACLSCCLMLNLTAFYAECEHLRNHFLRLHVIAASDSAVDQQLKLYVRDAVLTEGAALFDGSLTAEQAEEQILPALDKLTAAANRTLRAHGSRDTATISIQKEYFQARQYNDITLPAGMYEAVKVVIGSGAGQNWWCVMFPPMCLPAAAKEQDDYFSPQESDLLQSPVKYKAKLKIVEILQQLIGS